MNEPIHSVPPAPRQKHLLGVENMQRQTAEYILDTAEAFFEVSRRPVRKVPTLRGKTIVNLFYEPSTRTRTSFELAAKRLSADIVNLSVATSSVTKGETLFDTITTIQAMHPDMVVVRHQHSGAPHFVARHMKASILNAGDGIHEHPTQALLDAFTMRRAKGAIEGLTVAICGDVAHSRVAKSNAWLLRTLGAKVRFVAPKSFLPMYPEVWGAEVHTSLRSGLEGADVVMALRIQRERIEGARIPSLREYNRFYGITTESIQFAREDAIVMHPGPMNRGVEIDPDIADGPRSKVLDQVEAGVAVRMACLYMLGSEADAQ